MRTGECRTVAEVIPQFAAGDAEVDGRAVDHIEACLRCQAEVAAYRRILRHLHALHDEGIAPPVGSLAAVLAALDAAADQRPASANLGHPGRYRRGDHGSYSGGRGGRRPGVDEPETQPCRHRLNLPAPGRFDKLVRSADPRAVRAARCYPRSEGTRPADQLQRAVAQLAEHRSPKPAVGGSSPSCPAPRLV